MPPDPDRLRATVEHLASMERASASPGERAAAQWIADRLRAEGLEARVEVERAHGTYWIPLGILSAAGVVAAGLARVGRRRVAALLGAAAAAGIVEEVSAGPHVLRRLLPHHDTGNVVAEAGDPEADEILIFLAHHDAAHGGLVFDQRLVTRLADRFPEWFERRNTSPPIMRLVAGGPALVALGAATDRALPRALGATLSAASTLAFADIARSKVVPGANDNLTAVAVLLELARLLRESPAPGVRVMLVSTGSEESFLEGMRGFMRRHAAELPRDRTRVICIESVGSPHLILIEGEGMVRFNDYPLEMRELLAAGARRAGVEVRRGLRLGLATDGLISLKAGYPTATLASVTRYGLPANYHSPLDTPENVDWETVRRATAVCAGVIREVQAAS